MTWVNIDGAVSGSSMRINGHAAGNNIKIQLPDITSPTADYNVMGTMSLPVPTILDNMEITATKAGFDRNSARLLTYGSNSIEYRWTQMEVAEDGSQKEVFCRAYLRVVCSGAGGLSLEVGSTPESDFTMTVTRYQMFYKDEEMWLIDRMGPTFRVNGVDRCKFQKSVL
jgi:phage tail tube protein FII